MSARVLFEAQGVAVRKELYEWACTAMGLQPGQLVKRGLLRTLVDLAFTAGAEAAARTTSTTDRPTS